MTLQTSVLYQGPGGSSAYDAMGNVVFYQYRENSARLDQYTVTYLKKEGYLESATSGVNVSNLPDVRPATDESYYNTRGERIAIAQHTQYAYGTVADTVRVFSYAGMILTSDGEVVSRLDTRLTIEHVNSVVNHWNEVGYNSTRSVRVDFYNDTSNMAIRLRGPNSSDGGLMSSSGIRYRQDVGYDYSR
jgi:hypothetical protein